MSVLMASILITGLIGLVALGVKSEDMREIHKLQRKIRQLERRNQALSERLQSELYRTQIQNAKIRELNEAQPLKKSIKKIVM